MILNLSKDKLYSYYIVYMKTHKQLLHPLPPPPKKKALAKHLIANGISYQVSACRVEFKWFLQNKFM